MDTLHGLGFDVGPSDLTVRPVRDSVARLDAELGAPTGTRAAPRSMNWDLHTGGRSSVQGLSTTVILTILSPRYANIERGEERYGIDGDETPAEV